MYAALREAERAFEAGEVPIGAVIVAGNRAIGKGYNQTEQLQDPTAHAEMIALTAACNALGSKYLSECTLFVTVEPCPMCAAALRWAQLGRLVYGTPEPKTGFTRLKDDLLHPKTDCVGGVLADEARQLMQDFFRAQRAKAV